jgi:hypothetical protein
MKYTQPIHACVIKPCSIRSLGAAVVDDRGSATAEYAIATLAAVGFAGLLVVILRSDAVRDMLTNLIQHALSFSG